VARKAHFFARMVEINAVSSSNSTSSASQVQGKADPGEVRVYGPGDRGPKVAELQSFLRSRGYDVGSSDGIYGPRTERAVRKYNSDRGDIPPSGIVSRNTESSIKEEASGWKSAPSLSEIAKGKDASAGFNSKGEAVRFAQRALNNIERGRGSGRLAEDGHFGANTWARISDFQYRNNLEGTGVLDAPTLKALRQASARQDPSDGFERGPRPGTAASDFVNGRARIG
jgi:peptidoglycan hydrolase-like protein with peptidoglycan-binding domain